MASPIPTFLTIKHLVSHAPHETPGQRRFSALELAIKFHSQREYPGSSEDVVASAQKFVAFLDGEDTDAP